MGQSLSRLNRFVCLETAVTEYVLNHQGPAVRQVDSAIQQIVIFSTVVKMLQNYKTADIELIINKTKL